MCGQPTSQTLTQCWADAGQASFRVIAESRNPLSFRSQFCHLLNNVHVYLTKRERLTLCLSDIGPTSQTVAQCQTDIGSMSPVSLDLIFTDRIHHPSIIILRYGQYRHVDLWSCHDPLPPEGQARLDSFLIFVYNHIPQIMVLGYSDVHVARIFHVCSQNYLTLFIIKVTWYCMKIVILNVFVWINKY